MKANRMRHVVEGLPAGPLTAIGWDIHGPSGVALEPTPSAVSSFAALANHATALVDLVAACESVAGLGNLLHTASGTTATEFSAWKRMIEALAAVHAIGHVAPTDERAQEGEG